ncbi:MAG TPA: ATP-binding protein [Candidatus Paceibacterota bacterium]|nr:ATP-binding protein [Verrucomicrobiota bacterium]HRY46545.1 ATP-binding protein [Candidatus Paceibacterota bacterium]HSA02919.1 ATP-binding protein [Candidatus Paceibacterota bacterium]
MIRRHIEGAVHRAMADTPVVLLNGARQTGKTTLAQAIAVSTGAQYFTLDDYATIALAAGDPAGFIRNLDGPVVLDEIQKAPDLFPAIKLAVDKARQPGRFLLTGSANVMTLPRLSESLAGRMEIIPLYPFSAGELAGRIEGFLLRLFADTIAKSKPLSTSEPIGERLTRGGYPEATERQSDDRRAAWFASYLSTILQRDVRDLARVDALHSLPNLLKLLATRASGLLNLADVGRDASLPHTTLTRYLTLLETVFLVHRLPAWSRNLGQRLVKAPKVHLVDSGLACHLLGTDARRLAEDRPLLGRLLESFVVGELRKQVSWIDSRITFHHFRTATGSEVDVVLEKPDGSVAAIQVKASATIAASDFAALKALRNQLGKQFRAGVVLYLGDQIVPFGDRLWLVPMPALWEP